LNLFDGTSRTPYPTVSRNGAAKPEQYKFPKTTLPEAKKSSHRRLTIPHRSIIIMLVCKNVILHKISDIKRA